jgi:hypothetical protein
MIATRSCIVESLKRSIDVSASLCLIPSNRSADAEQLRTFGFPQNSLELWYCIVPGESEGKVWRESRHVNEVRRMGQDVIAGVSTKWTRAFVVEGDANPPETSTILTFSNSG